MTKPIPDGFHSITPIFVMKDTRKAIDFYKKAFGAEERFLMPGPGGKGVAHAEIKIGDSIVMLADEMPGMPHKSVETIGASGVGLNLYVPDADASFKRALAAGAKQETPMADMFWGDRAGQVKDPFGLSWWIMTHTRDLTPEQIEDGAKKAFGEMAGSKK